jgi:hypothetical protein
MNDLFERAQGLMQGVARIVGGEELQVQPKWLGHGAEEHRSVDHQRCGFRGKAGAIPTSSRSAFRNESGHDSGMNPGTGSDLNPVTWGYWSEL